MLARYIYDIFWQRISSSLLWRYPSKETFKAYESFPCSFNTIPQKFIKNTEIACVLRDFCHYFWTVLNEWTNRKQIYDKIKEECKTKEWDEDGCLEHNF